MHTESQKKICRVKRTAIQLTAKFHIEKFESAGEDLWSEGVSEVGSRAVWKIHVSKSGTGASINLDLVGPMKDGQESLEAAYHLYIVGESDGPADTLLRGTKVFQKDYWVGKSVDQVKKFLHADGSLVVGADVEFLIPDDSSEKAIRESDLFTKWHDSVSKLLEGGDNSDCILMVGGEQLKAHRSILSAISPIFGKMFGNELYQEAKDGIVRIEDPPGMFKDSTAKPYKALLSYAYTGCVDWTIYGECKEDILVVACKYYILDLKHHVEKLLVNGINTESFAELALLADAYSCKQLKKACVQHLSSTFRTVLLTPQWEALMKTDVNLACELLRMLREDETAAAVTDGGSE